MKKLLQNLRNNNSIELVTKSIGEKNYHANYFIMHLLVKWIVERLAQL